MHSTAQRLSVKLPAECDCRGKKLLGALQPSFPDLIRFFAKTAVKWSEKGGGRNEVEPLVDPLQELPSNTLPNAIASPHRYVVKGTENFTFSPESVHNLRLHISNVLELLPENMYLLEREILSFVDFLS